MLTVSRWAKSTAQLVQDQIGAPSGISMPLGSKVDYVIHLPAIYESLPSLHKNTLQQVARLCEPLFKGFQDDVDHIAHLLADLQTTCEEPEVGANFAFGDLYEDFINHVLDWDEFDPVPVPIIRPSTNRSIPTIAITPCPTESPEEDICRVPFQDNAFGQWLTVPYHAMFNTIHPPQALPASHSAPLVSEYWRWNSGHWEAVVPSLSEQTRRGLCSRANQPCRRKGAKSFSPRRFSQNA